MYKSKRSFPLSMLLVWLVITGILGFLTYMGMIEKSLTTASGGRFSHKSGLSAVIFGLGCYTAILILWLWSCAYSRYKNLIRLGLTTLWLLSLAAYAIYFL